MPVSIASNKDLKGIEAIWREHFTTDAEYLSIMFGEILPLCTSYVYKEGEDVISALSLMPMKFIDSVNNISLQGWYMFGVATLKEFWGKRLAAITIQEAISQLKEKGYQFIFERPANQSLNNYYLNLGFSKQLEYIPHSFNIKQESSTRNIDEIAENILSELSESQSKRFEWENKEILKGLIKLGELDFHTTIYGKTPPEGVYIAVNPLSNIPPETFDGAFFYFPME